MVVDDNQAIVEGLFLIFSHWGHDVRVAYDGETALRVALAFRPEVILLDIGLPGMDGYMVARRLRENSCFDHAILLAVTGTPGDDSMARAAGFDRVLLKPLEIACFAEEFRRIDAHQTQSRPLAIAQTAQVSST